MASCTRCIAADISESASTAGPKASRSLGKKQRSP
eukprot:CAMPEP_0170646734 /NCGR_PEP_ID=MMETSP0224-20130122/43798_1 /TAXON_ID=285029 /ORGANISM="Togula jolla, Strain CCCM 725" /LENGTH=34 /DNA_ID= /DNA_START= /DNA_END= /DNA_ORIENTATION=